MRWLILAALSLLQTSPASAPLDVSTLAVAPPLSIADLDRRTLGGTPTRLAWSPDGAYLYIQSRDGIGAAARVRHVDIRVATRDVRAIESEPTWADEYWHQKIAEAAPGMPWLKIDVQVDRERQRVAPLAGGFAGGAIASGTEAATTVTTATVRLTYLDVAIGQWPYEDPAAGVTFGWGPAGTGALAFTDRQGRVVLLDKERRQRLINTTNGSLLPAWSPDGHYIAFLQKAGRAKYRLSSIAMVRADAPLH